MKRSSCGSSCGSWGAPSGMGPSGMYPSSVSPSGMAPMGMNPSQMAPAQPAPLNPIVAPEQNIYKNFYHTAPQPIVHPVNIVNQHHTIPVPQHYCSYNVKNVNCGIDPRRSTRGRRR